MALPSLALRKCATAAECDAHRSCVPTFAWRLDRVCVLSTNVLTVTHLRLSVKRMVDGPRRAAGCLKAFNSHRSRK